MHNIKKYLKIIKKKYCIDNIMMLSCLYQNNINEEKKQMKSLTQANKARLEKLLSKWIKSDNKILTLKELLETKLLNGWILKEELEVDQKKETERLNRMKKISSNYMIGHSNEEIPAIKTYRKLESQGKVFKKNYYIFNPKTESYSSIPKMVYDNYK